MSLLTDKEEMIGIKKQIQELEQNIAFATSLIDQHNVNFAHWQRNILSWQQELSILLKKEAQDVKG